MIASRGMSGDGILTYRDIDDLLCQLKQHDIFGIINCAVAYGRGGESDKELENTNFHLPTQLAEYSLRNGMKLFINCDSFYRKFSIGVEKNKYIYFKKKTFNYLRGLNNQSQTKIINVTIHHMYGPNDSLHKIISSVVDRLKKGD